MEQLARHLTPVDLPVNRTLQEPGERVDTVYFLEDGICSMVVTMSSGATVEVGRIGRDGFVGAAAILDAAGAPGPMRENGTMDLIGVVDTMFARYDMGGEALDELAQCPGYGTRFTTVRRTVPGFKDLAVQAKKLIEEDGCRIVVALGMPGREKVDKMCAHEASTGIMTAQLMTNTPILEVFVHEDESDDPATLAMVFRNRSRDHARNAYLMLYEPEELTARAGQGVRQGFANAGPLEV